MGEPIGHISFPASEVRWGLRDVIAYALASGADAANGLRFVHEGRGPEVLPTFATRLAAAPLLDCFRDLLQRHPGARIRQVGARVSCERPIPPEGDARVHAQATTTPHPTGTTVELDAVIEQPDGPACHAGATILVQDDRPGQRSSGAGVAAPLATPDRSFHAIVGAHQYPTFRLLLPLSMGDPVPDSLHVEPGPDGSPPLLAGEVTLAMACRSIVDLRQRDDEARLRSISARFSGPVHVGDELTTEVTPDGDRWSFVVRNQLDRVVVDGGNAEFS